MRLRHLALPSVAGLALLAIPFSAPAVAAEAVCDPSVNTCLAAFDFTGGTQTFTVPAGVTNLIVALGGASGGNGLEGDDAVGGAGGAVEAIVPVTPGEALTLVVGGKGGDAVEVPIDDTNPTIPPVAAGGYGGGGAGTAAYDGPVGGGGGGSFLFGAAGALIAVGGGGGAGFTGEETDVADGGAGGATDATAGAGGTFGGGGATATAPGTAGAGDSGTAGSGPATGPDAFGAGGAAAGTCSAGGGGGGWFGGGSGACDLVQDLPPAKATAAKNRISTARAAAAPVQITPIYGAGGGGGGSGVVGAGVSVVADSAGALASQDGNGVIVLAYTTAPTTTTLATSATTLAPGEEATLDATVTGPALTIGSPADENSPAGRTARAAFGAAASKALAAAAVPTQPAADGTTVTPGTACGATPCTVTFLVNGVALGDPISVDPASGVASVVFTAGSDMGVRSVVARYDGNLYYLQSASAPVSIDVVGLANTGTDITPMLLAATGLLVAGGGLLAYGRRRPTLGAHRAA